MKVDFYDYSDFADERLKFAVTAARYDGKWIFVKRRERDALEIPGGHREAGENILRTAGCELFEETGAEDFSISDVCVYSVDDGEKETFGELFLAEINRLGSLPQSEIEKAFLLDSPPSGMEKWTYPLIRPLLFERVMGYLRAEKERCPV